MRLLMNGHGHLGLIAAGATAVAADHSIAVAIITAASGLTVVIAAQIGAAIRENRRNIDHDAEHRAELLELVEFLRVELVEAHSEIADLRDENKHLRGRRRG